MKKYSFVVMVIALLSVMFVGCIGHQYKDSAYCPPEPAADGIIPESWICEKSEDLNISPEATYGWIYAANVGAVFSGIERRKICDFDTDVANWYLERTPISYSDLINKILDEAELIKDEEHRLLINGLINRNLRQYASTSPIKPYDDTLIRGGNNWFRQDMLCGPLN